MCLFMCMRDVYKLKSYSPVRLSKSEKGRSILLKAKLNCATTCDLHIVVLMHTILDRTVTSCAIVKSLSLRDHDTSQ